MCLVVFAARPVEAQHGGVFYDCTITKGAKPNGWDPSCIAIKAQADGRFLSIDSVILAFKGKPIEAKLTKRNGKLIFRWVVDGTVDSAQQIVPNMNYRLTLD